jgi:cyclophilin family peptidyl-prolyl cis-trans isomerase/predicted DsbA family dithiol-disulfide isomerase
MIFKRLSFIILIALFVQEVFAAEVDSIDAASKKSTPVEVIFETTTGSYTLALYPDKAPKTVANFLTYVDEGFYDNTVFHRVIPGFVVQGGGFEPGMKKKQTHPPVENESDNGLKNTGGTISMARTRDPGSATSQFFINLVHNPSLDAQPNRPGYTVFGKVTEGMDVIGKIVKVPTTTSGPYKDVPREDVVILSARRTDPTLAQKGQERFIAGEHYVVLDRPVPTRENSKIEVVEMFSYGCPHCYEFEPLISEWSKQQAGDVDFWVFPVVWNKAMKLYARAFYAARELSAAEIIHHPLFTAIVIEQRTISNESELADFFANYGVDKESFVKEFNSTAVINKVRHAEERVRLYKPAGVPEIIVNGKYRIDRMRAGGLTEMLAVVDFLVTKERAVLKK